MLLLALALPLFQQLDDGLLHPGGSVALWKILAQGIAGEGDLVQVAFLFLPHDDPHHVEGQVALLAVFFQPLGLGERRRSLLAVHCVQQIHLFLFFEERQLIGGVEGDFLLIHHVQQFGDQLGEADITKNLVFTLADLFSQYLARLLPKIVPNLGTIFFGRSASLLSPVA